MKKLLMILIVFLFLNVNIGACTDLNEFNLDDFVCNYYERIVNNIEYLIEKEYYSEAKTEIEDLYNSKCRLRYVAELYLKILIKLKDYKNAYLVAVDNDLLDTENGLFAQANYHIVEKDSTQARSVYDNILIKSSYDKFAQMSLNQSYISTGSELIGLKELSKLDSNPEIEFLKAKAYYNLELFEDAMRILNSTEQTDDVIRLKNEIHRKRAFCFVSGYEVYLQKLNEEFKLDVNKIALSNSCYEKNMQVYLDYIMYVYTSGILKGQGAEPKNNITNEIRLGTQGRLNQSFALKADLGVKMFQDRGAMLLTDTWVKYYLNDNFNLKLGFHRNNSEQTFLSAVGVMIDNKFTGQIADNNLYLDSSYRLPNRAYLFSKLGVGVKEGDNIYSNPYWEGMIGVGKLIRYDLTKPFLQKISADIVSYNSGYRRNLENIYDSKGYLYGGYFSPLWYSDNTINLSFVGNIKNKFSYGYGAFSGWQFAVQPHQSMFIWGASAFCKYRAGKYLSMEGQYRYYRYANVVRNQLVFDLVISLFKSEKK